MSDLAVVAWTLVSLAAVIRLGVFRAPPLRGAAPRTSSLTFLHFAAAIILYIGFAIFAQSITNAVMRGEGGAAGAASTVPAAASATSSAAVSAASAASTSTTSPAGGIDTYDPSRRLPDDLARLLMAGCVVAMAAPAVRGGLRGFGLGLGAVPRGVVLGLLALAVILPILSLVQVGAEHLRLWLSPPDSTPPIHRYLQMFRAEHTPMLSRVLIVLSATVVAPLSEELLFRGLLQTILIAPVRRSADMPPTPALRWAAIVFASVVFTLIHWDPTLANWTHFPVLFVLSVALGYLYERTGNLWASIFMHVGFNGYILLLSALRMGT